MVIEVVCLKESWEVPKIVLGHPTIILQDCTRCTQTTTCSPNLTHCVFVNKVLWKHRQVIYLCIVHNYFSPAMSVLGSFCRNYTAHKA